jgi:hypothetical protein
MGAKQSQLGKQAEEGKQGFLQRILPGQKEFVPLPIPKIIDVDYILLNKPELPDVSLIQRIQNNQNNIILKIADKILFYNQNEWNFGNLKEGIPHKLMNDSTYKSFKEFVKNKIVKGNNFTPSNITVEYNEYFNKNTKIITEINGIGIPEVNKFFKVQLSKLFPKIDGLTENDFIYLTLLGLAAIIGSELLVIYFLMCGENPGIIHESENEDTGTLMLLYQIGLTKINSPKIYFIILDRMLYILFLLGSVGSGVNLSNIFKSNFKIFIRNQTYTQLSESILHQLVRMPYYYKDLIKDEKLGISTMQNKASIPLLFKIIEKNNINGPTLWNDINAKDVPLGYTVLYSLLMNNTIEGKIKLSLVWYLINVGANPLIIPNIRQNSTVKESVFAIKNQTEIQILFALLQESNINILGNLLKILSNDPKFKEIYDEFKETKPGINQDKNMIIIKLKKNNDKLKEILFEVAKLKKGQIKLAIQESELVGSIQKKNIAMINSKQLEEKQKLENPLLENPRLVQPGGKRITVRTFYLLKHTKYSKQPFKAERPITAAHNAYDYLKLYDKIGKKQINMTIYDITNNKKYKYLAKTLKDGKNVLKSYK